MNNITVKHECSSIKQRKNHRYKDFDYSSDGYYYVTICTYMKRNLFGIVKNNNVVLNALGQIVDETIMALNKHQGIEITTYIVMPNHIHILFEIANVENKTHWSLPSLIIRIKSKVVVEFSKYNDGKNKKDKIWQRNYWDYIVRKQEELAKITEYINMNPEFWESEKDNPDNEYYGTS